MANRWIPPEYIALVAKANFFIVIIVSVLCLGIGILLSGLGVEPAGSFLIEGGLCVLFGLTVGLCITPREIAIAVGLGTRGEVLELEDSSVQHNRVEEFVELEEMESGAGVHPTTKGKHSD